MHHWMYGVILIIVSFVASSVILYAVGLGLFVDELSYILIGEKNHKDNYSTKSLLGTVLFVIIVFIFKHQILSFLFLF